MSDFFASQAMGQSNDYVPTTEEMRALHSDDSLWSEPEDQLANFDRWLARVKSEAAAEAWDVGWVLGNEYAISEPFDDRAARSRNPYRAAEIREAK